jgi:type I restriction enzyme S subunit
MLTGRVSLTSQERSNFDVRTGDILFTRTSETPGEVGMASVVLDETDETVFSGFLLRARPKTEHLCKEFMAYCFQSHSVRNQIVSKASYTTRALTNGKALSTVIIVLPEPREQAAIATVVSDMDSEIALLEAKLSKAFQIKHGMMQELLTGRIRLV